MIICAGNNEICNYVTKKAAEELNMDCQLLAEADIDDIEDEIIRKQPKYAVISVEDFEGSEEEIVDCISRISRSVNVHIIIFAPSYNAESKILMSLRAMGLNMQVTTPTLSQIETDIKNYIINPQKTKQEEIDEIIDIRQDAINANLKDEENSEAVGNTDALLDLLAFEREDAAEDSIPEETKIYENNMLKTDNSLKRQIEERHPYAEKIIKIAVTGCMKRIGTTTVSLQFAKYLNSIEEHSAAYLEFDGSGYIKRAEALLLEEDEKQEEKVTYADLDMYYDPALLPEIMSGGYRYIIYDYGDIKEADIPSVLDKDIILLVGGSTADEIPLMTGAMKIIYDQRNVFYIFNYTAPADFPDVKEAMEHLANKTYNMSYCPDPFKLCADNKAIFNSILKSDYKRVDVTDGKKNRMKGLFIGRR